MFPTTPEPVRRLVVRVLVVAAVVAAPLIFLARSHHVGKYAEMPHGVTHQVQIWRSGQATYLRDVYVGPEIRVAHSGPAGLSAPLEIYAYKIEGGRLKTMTSEGLRVEDFGSSKAAWRALELRTFYRPNIELALASGWTQSKPSWTQGL